MEVWQKCVAFIDAGTCWGYNETWFVQIPRVAERVTYKTLGNSKQLRSNLFGMLLFQLQLKNA